MSEQSASNSNRHETRKGSLGTFGGVFTPSILTILGIILFMRLGFVVGEAGLKRALIMIALANAISVMTTFSLSAIATNLKVKGGGDYYLISRTLGLEFGGAIGIVLFLAQSVSIAFYLIGFGEALNWMLPWATPHLPQIAAACATAVLFVLACLGADWATKFQYLVMCALIASLVSFFIGAASGFDTNILAQNWTAASETTDFWLIFAIFFPAVTGFTQGVSMSGDLKNPGKSLPLGTFLAVGISMLVYLCSAILFAGNLPSNELSSDFGAMKRIAASTLLINVGIISATLSSAMASFLGAPRILQSLARDRIFPFLLPFAKGSGAHNNPRRGVLLSAGIALATISLGKLNIIAPVVSMFFLISYGLLNYATFYEVKASSPSFRPRFKWFDHRLSLLGALACFGAMAAINIMASAVAASILIAIHQYLKRTAGPARWADSRRSHHFHLLRENLFALASEPEHPRDWRPRLLVFSKDSKRRGQLLRFSSWIEGSRGLTTAVKIIEGHGARIRKEREEAEEALRKEIAGEGLDAFSLVIAAPNMLFGARILIQAHGLGPVRPNTVILNWMEQRPGDTAGSGKNRYGRYLQTALRLGLNVVVLDTEKDEWSAMQELPSEKRRIDVWWFNDATSRLMLLLAYMMTRNDSWSDAAIRVIAPSGECSEKESFEGLERMLDEARIQAEPVILARVDADTLVERSKDAALVFMPLRITAYEPKDPFGERPDELFTRLPVVAMMAAAEDIPLDAEPEDGKSAESAARLDAAEDAEKKADVAERDAAGAEKDAEKKLIALQKIAEKETNPEKREMMEEAVKAAKELAEKAFRRAAKARTKAETALREAKNPPTETGLQEKEKRSN